MDAHMDMSIEDWRSGRVIHWDLSFIDVARPTAEQTVYLKEDLAQVAYPDDIVIDVGWYPEFRRNGRFVVSVVRRQDWERPLMQARCVFPKRLPTLLREAVSVAMNEQY
jgi:hypothetical protein